MAISWRLKTYLATKYGIYSAVALQRRVTEATGVVISAQNLRAYLNEKPKLIPLRTIELICTALQCELSAFCEVKPKTQIGIRENGQPKKLAFHNTPIKKRTIGMSFPDPNNYDG